MKNSRCLLLLVCLSFVLSGAFAQSKKSDKEMFKEGYVMKPSDIRYAPPGEKFEVEKIRLYSISDRGKETIVTFVQPIYFDSQWLSYSPGFQIVDKASGDVYKVRRYDDGLPMDRLLIVKGSNRKNLLISLVFPKLKKKVKFIDIIEAPHENQLVPSNDNGNPTSFYNVFVPAYRDKDKRSGKVYE